MAGNFDHYENEIRKYLLPLDINYFINDLKCLFSEQSFKFIISTDYNARVNSFMDEFQKLEVHDKFDKFKISAKEHNKWIYRFLTVDLNNRNEVLTLAGMMTVLDNLLDMLYRGNRVLWTINVEFIYILRNKEIITEANKDHLLQRLQNFGHETTMFELFNVISARTSDWYGVILCAIIKQDTAFAEIIRQELDLQSDDDETEEQVLEFSRSFIEKHIDQFREENPPMEESNSDGGFEEMSMDGAESVASTMRDLDIITLDDEMDMSWLDEDEMKPTQLIMKTFQLELAELATKGQNVIVFAPTGIGKTIVAIYIANDHLRRNPNGKVAFLVPRRHLVEQQFTAIEKYKDPEIRAMEMRGKSEKNIGPLISHLDGNQIFVMTGGIFFNALVVDDGNKLGSIDEFSLIFFDECHNCMKLNPYNQIMSVYIKEKVRNPGKKMPQIVGLTASIRSNNSDDKRIMKKSVIELCANLDCLNFSFVKQHIDDLKEEIITPVQEAIHVPRREQNDFERLLMELMDMCERKLEKMKKERYFTRDFKAIPKDRFQQTYIGFVGNLQKQNNDTIDENDGKQKVYAIYRYLNAFYRGLIVHQLFDEDCAKECIERHLEHDGKTFTCCYEEEFHRTYKEKLSVDVQSCNPAIETITYLIKQQFKENSDSRVIVFVQQKAYTQYLVDLLQRKGNIDAESIVGRNSKNILPGCSANKVTDIIAGFREGTYKVLVVTSVLEEGLDVPNCNLVICYAYVTNEIAYIQRLGRARSVNSKYFLILPPMFSWMEAKECNNRRRNEGMMKLIHEYDQMGFNSEEVIGAIKNYQNVLFHLDRRLPVTSATNSDSWLFKCRSCQRLICTSEELRVLEISHIVCINPDVIRNMIFIEKERKVYGLSGNYELIGSMQCQCRNHKVGKKVLYLKQPFLQIRIDRCSVIKNSRSMNFNKWKDFHPRLYRVPAATAKEIEEYVSHVWDL